MNQTDKVFDFLVLAEKLKTIKRDNLKSNGEFETDADHCWMMALMAILFEPSLKEKVDMIKVMKMIVVHDIAEAKTGDVPLYKQFGKDGLKESKDKAELEAMKKIHAMLPGDLGDEIYNLWREYEERETMEAKFVKALDKLEGKFQSLCYKDVLYWMQYGDGKFYYDNILNDRQKRYWEHEKKLIVFGEKLKEIATEKMLEVGLNPAEYIKNG